MNQQPALLPSVNISVNLQVRYLVAALFIGPMFGLGWGGVFYGIAWFLTQDVAFLQCYAAGWLLATLSFCFDIRRDKNLLFLEITPEEEPAPRVGPPAFGH